MHHPVITLTTDFGADSPYVAALKGVVLSVNPSVFLIDLSHQIPPQDVVHTAYFLAAAVPFFPKDTLHVVVVDPGVGTERALLYVEAAGQRLLVPDNGCWTELARAAQEPKVIRLAKARFWRQPVSATFHGRDILAPVAAHLSLGVDPRALGPTVNEWVRLELPAPRPGDNQVIGQVVFVDRFGNLMTNIPADMLRQQPDVLAIGKKAYTRKFRWVRTYGEAKPGTLLALISSSGTLEVAVNQGSAAKTLSARPGTPVVVGWKR